MELLTYEEQSENEHEPVSKGLERGRLDLLPKGVECLSMVVMLRLNKSIDNLVIFVVQRERVNFSRIDTYL